MANEETPAYINYGDAPDASYSHKDLIKAYKEALAKRGVSWLPTVKDTMLAKRMVAEYGDQAEIIALEYIKVHVHASQATKFNYMYTERHTLAQRLTPKDYSEWD